MKKKYETPALKVTELETEDVIAVSALMDEAIIAGNEHLGYTAIEIDF